MHSGFIVGNNYKDNDSTMINLSTSAQMGNGTCLTVDSSTNTATSWSEN